MTSETPTLFAVWEAFWLDAWVIWMFPFYHLHYMDRNEQYETHCPCSDKPQFWPPMIMPDDD